MQTHYNKIKKLYNHLGYDLPDGNTMPTTCELLKRQILIDAESEEMRWAPNLPNLLHELTDIITLALGTAAMAGFTANQLNMAMELVTEANMRKTVVNGVITKPEGWEPADLSPCFFVEKDYPEWYKENYRPPHEIGYRYVKLGELTPKGSQVYHTDNYLHRPPFWLNSSLIGCKKRNTSTLVRVPANHPITIQP